MKWTATCPSCNKEINILRIIFAVTPFSFKCNHCSVRIFVRKITLLMLFVMGTMGTGAILLFQHVFHSGKYANNLSFALPFALVIAIQITSALLICNKAHLEVKN